MTIVPLAAENPLLPAPAEIIASIVFALLLTFIVWKFVVPRFEQGDSTVLVDGSPVTGTTLDPADEARRRIGPDDLFLINSTSGTTGLPKCVTHHQNRWMYFHRKAAENGDLTTDDVFFAAIATPFGFGLWTSHVTPLVLGATVLTVERFDAEAALHLIVSGVQQ